MIVLKIINTFLAAILVGLSGYKLHRFHSYDKFENGKMMIELILWCC